MAALPPGIAGGPNVGAQPQNQQAPGLTPDFGYGAYAKALGEIPQSPQLQQTPYQKPKATGEIIAGALNLLFPGSQISKMASSFIGGEQKGAEQTYERANKENEQKYQAAENTRNDAQQNAQVLGQQYDAQMRLHDQQVAEADRVAENKVRATEADAALAQKKAAEAETARIREEQNRIRLKQLAEEHYKNAATIEESRQKYALAVKNFGLNEDKFNQTVRRDNSRVAMFLTGKQMSADTAQQRMGLTAKLATFREFAQDRRNANDQLVKIALAKSTQTRLQAEHAIAIEAKNPADDDATKQQKIAALQDGENKSFNDTITPLVSKYQHLGEAMDHIDSVTQEGLGTEAQQNAEIESGVQQSAPQAGGGTTIIEAPAAPQQSPEEIYEAILAAQSRGGVTPPAAVGAPAAPPPAAGARPAAPPPGAHPSGPQPQQVPVTPEGAQVPTPQMVQQAIPLAAKFIQSGQQDAAISAQLAGAGYTPTQVQEIIGAARQNFNQIESGTDQRAARMRAANAGQGQPSIQVGGQQIHPIHRAPAQSENPFQSFLDRGLQNTLSTPANLSQRTQAPPPPVPAQYAQQILAQIRKMNPQQQAAFIAKQPPQIQALIMAGLQGR